jgi:hypothetical protein
VCAEELSGQHGLDHTAMDIGEAVVATTEAVGQPLMVDAQKV